MLECMRSAKKSINVEAYILEKGEPREFIAVLSERARAGVRVNVVIDAIGSFRSMFGYLSEVTDAGGNVYFYHGFKWHQLPRLNSRTHRELVIVDCKVGFVGGPGFADHWLYSRKKSPRWRDTMFRLEGDSVASLQSTFIENYLEASGELLTGDEYFSFDSKPSGCAVLVVDSSVSSGQSTARGCCFRHCSARRRTKLKSPRLTFFLTKDCEEKSSEPYGKEMFVSELSARRVQ